MSKLEKGDMDLVLEFVLLPIVLSVFERDKLAIEQSNLKIKTPYLDMIDVAMNKVIKQLRLIKDKMRLKKLNVIQQAKNDYGIYYKFRCRGYIHESQMRWELVKAETQVRMQVYLSSTNNHS